MRCSARSSFSSLIGFCLALLLLLGASVAPAAEPVPETALAPAPSADELPAGLTVAIDPRTGELRAPTAAELAELAALAPRRLGDRPFTPTIRMFASGMRVAYIGEEQFDVLVAELDAHGAPVLACTSDPAAALSAPLAQAAPRPAVLEVK